MKVVVRDNEHLRRDGKDYGPEDVLTIPDGPDLDALLDGGTVEPFADRKARLDAKAKAAKDKADAADARAKEA